MSHATPPRAEQLALPCTLDQATLLAQHIARLEGKLDAAYDEIAALTQERDTYWQGIEWWQKEGARLEDELTAADAKLDVVERHLSYWRGRYQVPGNLHDEGMLTLPPWLDAGLKALIATAHPDKWSAQQPASELAHALTVALNGMRAKLGEGRP